MHKLVRLGGTIQQLMDEYGAKGATLQIDIAAMCSIPLGRVRCFYIPAADDPSSYVAFNNKELLLFFASMSVSDQKLFLEAIRNAMKKEGVKDILFFNVKWQPELAISESRSIRVYMDGTGAISLELDSKTV